jgi:hypothetical protein
VHPNPVADSQFIMAADLCGDFRDELVLLITTDEGAKAIAVVTSTTQMSNMYISPGEVLDYRLWLGRNMGGGYKSQYYQPLIRPGTK